MNGSLYIVSAPSGAGKTSLVSKLLELDSKIKVSVSSTTRPKRPGEQGGVNYHFLTVEDFQKQIETFEFLEHAKVFDNHYGTSKTAVDNLRNAGKDVILEIDWQGAQQIRHQIPDAISIFILPPSKEELLRRLTGRGTDSEEVITRRMQDSVSEMSHYNEFDYIVINNNFDLALKQLQSIFMAGRLTKASQVVYHKVLIDTLISKD